MEALSNCLSSLALFVAGSECFRLARKHSGGPQESSTKVIEGVPVLGFYSRENPVHGSWIVLFKGGAPVMLTSSDGVIPSVISMSLGGRGRDEADSAAIGAATAAGITIVVATGNARSDACRFSPAFAEKAITVGDTDGAVNCPAVL